MAGDARKRLGHADLCRPLPAPRAPDGRCRRAVPARPGAAGAAGATAMGWSWPMAPSSASIAKPEPLVEAVATDARHLARLAWHVGNRHRGGADRRPDLPAHRARFRAGRRCCAASARETRTVNAPFHPEGGAYASLATGARIMDTIDRAMSASDGAARLLTWLSPAFPVGAFSYSHGLEYAVEAGLVSDRATLIAWIEGIVRYGAGAAGRHAAAGGASRGHGSRLQRTEGDRGARVRDARQRRAGARIHGARRRIPEGDRHRLAASRRRAAVAGDRAHDRPVVPGRGRRGGRRCRHRGNARLAGLSAPPSAAISSPPPCASRRSAKATASRRSPLLEPTISRQVERLRAAPFETIGAASLMVDWCSMRHETQETRLFRS